MGMVGTTGTCKWRKLASRYIKMINYHDAATVKQAHLFLSYELNRPRNVWIIFAL